MRRREFVTILAAAAAWSGFAFPRLIAALSGLDPFASQILFLLLPLIDRADCRKPEALLSFCGWRSLLPLCICDAPSRYEPHRMMLQRPLLLALQSDRHR